MAAVTTERLESAFLIARSALMAERTPEGHWVGELSTSALSTATAVAALALVRRHTTQFSPPEASLVDRGLAWLAAHQNPDGGWGDTVRSFSNISTTMLCRAVFPIAGQTEAYASTLARATAYMEQRYGATAAAHAEAIRARYGIDRTFSVPILMMSALGGLVSWHEVPRLPFELACFPQSWFRFLRLPVVSYALPALIAIGQTIHHHRRSWNPLLVLIRGLAAAPSRRVLQAIQPSSGGYLEATPLTSFVTMALASMGQADHPVVRLAVEFLVRSVRPDGSWPIDTNLATWVTTLSINALASAGEITTLEQPEVVRDFLLHQQYRVRHPFTGAAPGGFAWTNLPGGVPDADDTPGALLALRHLSETQGVETDQAYEAGSRWLLDLQNRDGGWPTFCRGWGHLPFDRSGPDLTAHVLRALHHCPGHEAERARQRGWNYLERTQRPDGSWLPLWFGNQQAPEDENPTYGTARVLAAYHAAGQSLAPAAQRGLSWLRTAQNPDGGWGGAPGTPSSVEETALALEVSLLFQEADETILRALNWLLERVESGALQEASPIGFYFAKLWYFEKMYPIIFTVAALGQCRHWMRARQRASPASSGKAP